MEAGHVPHIKTDEAGYALGSSPLNMDRRALLQGLGRRLRDELSLEPVVQRGRWDGAALHGVHKGVEGVVVTGLYPFEPSSVEAVLDDLGAAIPGHPTEALAARLDQALRAE